MDDGASPKLTNAEKNNWFGEFWKKLNRKSQERVTEEEIISMVNEGHEKGVLQANEAEMIHNIFDFTEKEAKDIMTHRKNITALDGTQPFCQTLDAVLEEQYSRFPVYVGDIDNIIGILHIKEVLAFSRKQELWNTPIRDIEGLFTEADFIPETRNISDLFQKMQAKKAHMVIVVDEYGQTSGLVAMEDILEEIVGNIFDEHDREDRLIEKISEQAYMMQGMASLDEIGELLHIEFDEEEYDTLNGFLISQIDKIPADGETFSVSYGGYAFDVLRVENKTIQTVRVRRLYSTGEDSACHSQN